MKMWQNGDLKTLFVEAEQMQYEVRKAKNHNFKRTFRLCSLGRYSDALRALEEVEFAAFNNSTLEKLLKLHPKKSTLVTVHDSLPASVVSSENIVMDCLRSFPRGTSPGLEGYRPEHLLDACHTTQNRSTITLITNFINLIISGDILPEVREWFSGGRLCALAKEDGEVRPICIGSVWRRLASKVVCSILQPKFLEFLAPTQIGVAVKSGAEILIHEVDLLYRTFKKTKDFVVLKIDWKNAFNSVDRQLFLDAVHKHFPEIYNFISAMYSVKGRLKFGDNFLLSEEGTQQGDPLGPVLFSIALKILTDKLNTDKLAMNRWYLDDGNLAGKVKHVAEALDLLMKEGKSVGLSLRMEKTELFYPSGSMFKRNIFPEQIKVRKSGVVMLGAPIGTAEYVSQFFDKQYTVLNSLLDNLKKASSSIGSQCTFILLSKCVSFCRMVYNARTVHPSAVINHACNYDSLVQECFSLLVPGLTEQELSQCTFPIRNGGLGLRKLAEHCVPAFLSSARVELDFLNTDFNSADSHWNLSGLLDNFNAKLTKKIKWKEVESQKALSAMMERVNLDEFASGLLGNDKHRLIALQGTLSSGWLSAIPECNNRLTSAEFETSVRLRLGGNMFSDESTCDFCGDKRVVDCKGLHALVCKGGGDRISRHNILRDLLARLCGEAALSVEKVIVEKKWLVAGSKARPADIFIKDWNGGLGLALDVTVTSPLQAAFSSSYTSGLAAITAADKKVNKYKSVAESNGFQFLPFAVESFGILEPRATKFLSTLISRLATRREQPISVTTADVCRKLSVALHRSLARSILKRSKVVEDVVQPVSLREYQSPTFTADDKSHHAIGTSLAAFLDSAKHKNSKADKDKVTDNGSTAMHKHKSRRVKKRVPVNNGKYANTTPLADPSTSNSDTSTEISDHASVQSVEELSSSVESHTDDFNLDDMDRLKTIESVLLQTHSDFTSIIANSATAILTIGTATNQMIRAVPVIPDPDVVMLVKSKDPDQSRIVSGEHKTYLVDNIKKLPSENRQMTVTSALKGVSSKNVPVAFSPEVSPIKSRGNNNEDL